MKEDLSLLLDHYDALVRMKEDMSVSDTVYDIWHYKAITRQIEFLGRELGIEQTKEHFKINFNSLLKK